MFAWWLEKALGKGNEEGKFKTFAYMGSKDLRYPVLAVAAALFSRKTFQYLLEVTECQVFVYDSYLGHLINENLSDSGILRVHAPKLKFGIDDACAPVYEYGKIWEEAKDDPWIIFYTSGTAGKYCRQSSLDYDTQINHFIDQRIYAPLPALHFIGMTILLQMTVLLGSIAVIGPETKFATASSATEVLKYGSITAAILLPNLIEDLCRLGVAPRGEGLYEPVFRRKEEWGQWQQIFQIYPDLDEYCTKDLMRPHPTKPNIWAYVGRIDDSVLLSSGVFLNAAAMENSVASNSAIEAAIVRGQGRKKPFLLVEVDEEHCLAFGAESREEVIDLLWPAILEVNFASTEATRLMKSLIIIADSARPFVRRERLLERRHLLCMKTR
ncbi:hypothetical protein B0J14DRAFT_643097 [Halenospora varia]|nr:hypothetical protein B0J14DRAFT_643097 [Halenospora varia]